jgi:AcrR family transcriptional regulator
METRQRISAKAKEMFMRYGIRTVSMDDIAGGLGISKKTIYGSFEDKDALVDSIIAEHLREAEALVGEIHLRSEDAVQEIVLTMRMVEVQFRHLNPIVLHDLRKFHPTAYARLEVHKEEFLLGVIRGNMERGKAEGLYRPELDVEVMSRFRLESMMVLFDVDLFPPDRFSLVRASQEVLEHFLYGLATPLGRDLIERHRKVLAEVSKTI